MIPSFSSVRLCEITGVTYRQLDYWARTGLLVPSVADARGVGTRRRWSVADVRCVVALGAVSPSTTGGRSDSAWHRVRRLIAEAYRERPTAEYVVILDGTEVVLCDSVWEAVAATHRATVATVIWPDRVVERQVAA